MRRVQHFKTLQLGPWHISTVTLCDSCMFLKDGTVVVAENFVRQKDGDYVLGRKYRKEDNGKYADIYTYPLPSSKLDI